MHNVFDDLLTEIRLIVRQEVSNITPGIPSIPAAPNETEEDLLDVGGLSRFLKIAKSSVYSNKDIPKVKRGKKIYFIKSEVLKWLRSGRIQTPAEVDSAVDAGIKKSLKKLK
jgi:hypothetical protein